MFKLLLTQKSKFTSSTCHIFHILFKNVPFVCLSSGNLKKLSLSSYANTCFFADSSFDKKPVIFISFHLLDKSFFCFSKFYGSGTVRRKRFPVKSKVKWRQFCECCCATLSTAACACTPYRYTASRAFHRKLLQSKI